MTIDLYINLGTTRLDMVNVNREIVELPRTRLLLILSSMCAIMLGSGSDLGSVFHT